jgi:hypothetical protein
LCKTVGDFRTGLLVDCGLISLFFRGFCVKLSDGRKKRTTTISLSLLYNTRTRARALQR